SNFALSLLEGSPGRKRKPASASPSSTQLPPSSVCAETTLGIDSAPRITRKRPARLMAFMGTLLSGERVARRMVRPVDDRVTAQARASHRELQVTGGAPVGARGVPRLDVALLAETGRVQ